MKIAIVGAGVVARVHVKALAALGMQPAAVCDIDIARAEALLREFSLDIPVFTDYETMLTEFSPELVHICTPHHLHADMVVSALEKNVHVLSEKPLCIKESDIPRILAAQKASHATLGVCHQNRYNPANLFVKEHLQGKQICAAHGTVAWHRDAAYYATDAWRGKWETEGGGVMINQALHTLDLCEWLLGEPETVTATVSNLSLDGVIEVEDTAAATFKGANPFTFFATNAAAVSMPVSVVIRTVGEEIVLLPHSVMINGEAVLHEPQNMVLGKACYGSGHVALLADFYRCVQEGKPFAIDGNEGAKVIRLILAMYKSEGKEITL